MDKVDVKIRVWHVPLGDKILSKPSWSNNQMSSTTTEFQGSKYCNLVSIQMKEVNFDNQNSHTIMKELAWELGKVAPIS